MIKIKALGYRTQCNQNWNLAAHWSKAKKETKLVERKVCLILDAGSQGLGEWRLSKSWLLFPQHSGGKNFSRLKEGATCRNNTVSSDKCHLDTVTDWFSSFQLLNCDQLFVIPWTAVHQASLSITNSWSLLKLMSIKSVMPLNCLILCHPLLLPPSIFIRVFSSESILHIRWPKYWNFSFNISPSSEHPGLISFRMDWLDLLAVQWTLKSLLQHHSSKASILQHSAFFIVQLSHPYMTTGNTIALTRRTRQIN